MLDFNRGSGCTGPGWKPPDPIGLAGALIAGMSEAQVAQLSSRYLSPAALRQKRLAARDHAIRELVTLLPARSGRALANAVETEINRYAASAWRWECGRPEPADPDRALLHRVLTLSRGNPPRTDQVRRIIAGARSRGA